MAITQNTFTGDGSTTNFSFTFEYIKQSDVKASLDGTSTTAFTLANATTLSFNTAPANGVAIRIFRDTAIDSLKATFFPGSAIKAEDLNDNFTQNNFAVQEADFDVATSNATANTAKTTADTAIATANTASTNATAAVSTANTASTNASAAVSTANTASTNASNAVTTANSAATDAAAAVTTANSATTTANGAVTTANAASATANAATSTANTAASDAASAVSTANTASTNASNAVATANGANTTAGNAVTTANAATATANSAATDAAAAVSTANTASTTANSAVTTANSAASDATSAVSTANTASTNASNAVTTANTASTTATAALNNSRESDGQGGFTSAIDKANAAITASNTATAAVSNAVLFDLIANVSSIPGSPSNNDYIEIGNSTGIQSFTPLSGLPSGFVGAAGLTVRLRYDSSATSWVFMNYFANDSETRYVAIGNPNPTYYANQAAFPSATTYHGGVAHSHADGAMYYAHGGNWIKMAKDSDVTTKLPLAGGTLTGDLTLSGAPTSNLHAATKAYVDTEVAGLVDAAPGTLDTLNELAAALGDDANFSTTVTNSIATKMPLAGGTFTGNVEISTGIDLNTDGSATLAGGIDLASTTNSGAKFDANGQLTIQKDSGSENLFRGYNQTTNTVLIKADGSATFNGNVTTTSGFFANPTSDKGFQIRQSPYSSNDATATIFTDGSATFNGNVTLQANLDMQHNDKILLGVDDDLQIYHDGSNSYIKNNTNSLHIQNTANDLDIVLQTDNGSGGLATYIECDGSTGKVELYYYGSEKIRTESTGVRVTGEVQCDSLDVDGSANIDGRLTVIDRIEAYAPGNGDYAFSGYGSGSSGNSHLFRGATSGGTVVAEILDNGDATFDGDCTFADNKVKAFTSSGNGVVRLFTSADAQTIQLNGTDGSATFAGTVTDSIGDVRRLGIVSSSVDLTLSAASHAGKLIRMTSTNRTFTIPSGSFSSGDMITIFNVGTGNMTIAQGSSVTLYNTADGTTGNRTLAAKGMVTIACTDGPSNEFVISGTQLS